MTRSEKFLCITYGLIAVSALVGTWIHNIAFALLPGNGGAAGFIGALYAHPAAASITNDLLFFAVAGSIFMVAEGRRLGMRHVWVYLVLSLVTAVSVMFPVFLIFRQYTIARGRRQGSAAEAGIESVGPA
jgi:hypothetical protein